MREGKKTKNIYIKKTKKYILRNDGTMVFIKFCPQPSSNGAESKIVVLYCQKVLTVLSSSHMILLNKTKSHKDISFAKFCFLVKFLVNCKTILQPLHTSFNNHLCLLIKPSQSQPNRKGVHSGGRSLEFGQIRRGKDLLSGS